MAKYWLDTSVFIEAHRGELAFDLNPEFWESLERDARAGLIASPMLVHKEIVEDSDREDLLSIWAKRLKDEGVLFTEPDDAVLNSYTQIADYIHQNCDASEGDGFLDDADPWVIAHAMAGSTVVVSQEKAVGLGSKRIQIPNICSNFAVGCIRTDRYLREIKEERG